VTDAAGAPRTLRRLAELRARTLWIAYHDYAGVPRAKAVTADRIPDAVTRGVTWAKANWDIALNDELIPHPAFAADSGDFVAIPDPATLVPLAWRPGVAQALSDLVDDLGGPWDGDPRRLLRRQVDELAALGLEARVAFEAEFVLVEPAPAGGWMPADHGRMFTVAEIDARWPWFERVLDALAAMEIPVHQVAREYGVGQYEISLLPADPLTAADRFLLARQAIKAIAREEGLVASFMPKPWSERPGNGLHVHVSLWRGGDEATADPHDESGLSAAALSGVAGLLDHAPAQAALAAPTPNSYKRLLPGSWAPAHVCWAIGNRAALVRVPGRGVNRRLEYRSGDASSNPYLHLTGLLAAIVDGIRTGGTPPDPVAGDVGHWTDEEAAERGIARLPASLEAALDALDRDGVLRAALGPIVDEHYRAVKRFELAVYREQAGASRPEEVTEWERTMYLEPL